MTADKITIPRISVCSFGSIAKSPTIQSSILVTMEHFLTSIPSRPAAREKTPIEAVIESER